MLVKTTWPFSSFLKLLQTTIAEYMILNWNIYDVLAINIYKTICYCNACLKVF